MATSSESPSKRPDVDQRVYDLAEWFIWDTPGCTEDDVWELARVIQAACEDADCEIKDRGGSTAA